MNLNRFQWRSLKTRITLFTLVIFLFSLWSLAFYASQMLRQDMQRLLGEQQFSTVSLLAADVNSDLLERLSALERVAGMINPAMMSDAAKLQKFLEDRPVFQSLFSGGAAIVGPDGTVMADVPLATGRIGLHVMDLDVVTAALRDGKSSIGQPAMGTKLLTPVFAMAAAIRDAQGTVIGAVGGVVNLAQPNFLDKITQNHYGRTGGYLLISPVHRQVVTATDKSRIMEKLPAPGINPLIDRFMQGYEGSAVGVNPLGVEILASDKAVPAAGWIMSAVLPTEEAFAPIRVMQHRMLLATLMLTLLAGALTWWMLRRELSPLLAAAKALAGMSDTKNPPQAMLIPRQSEIGALIQGFNRLLETLAQREQALQENRRLLRESQRVAGLGTYALDITTGYWTSSDVFDKLFGIEKTHERTIEAWEALLHPDDRAMMVEYFKAEVLGQGRAFDREYRIIRHNDRAERWVHGLGSLEFDARGQPRKMFGTIQDVTERRQAQLALQQSETRYRTLVEWTPEAIAVHRDGGILYVNPAAIRMAGARSARDLVGKPIFSLIHPDFHQSQLARLKNIAEQGVDQPMVELQLLKLDGTVVEVELQTTLIDYDGKPAFHAAVHDVTERKHAQEKLHLAASVFTHAREGIIITSADGAIIDVNDAFTRISGYLRHEVLGQNPHLLSSGHHHKEFFASMWRQLNENGHWYGEIWNRRKNGEMYVAMQTISAVRDAEGGTRQYVALFSDITAFKDHERELEHIAHYDSLTSLANRVLLADRLHQAMALALRREQRLAVAFLDLDGFKAINDSYGHDVGDQLLIALATRMKLAMRDGDTLARMGGDEFVAVLVDLADSEASLPVLSRLLAAAAQPVRVGRLVLQVSASLGVTFYPQVQDVAADQLLRQADQAMYQAKLAGKNSYHIFDAERDSSIRGHHESLEHIRHALSARQFVLHYQPKVNMRTGTIIGAEALIRWQHPEQGLLLPAMFLPVIEDHALAIELGEWMLNAALTQMAIWKDQGLDIAVSVNVGAHQLQQVEFVERLGEILAAHPQVKPSRLQLEVLETSALEDLARTSQVIEACRDIGVSFALDDFGTGYSSLTYLKRLPVALLKIDQSFVRDMLDDPDGLAILAGVIGLASAFRRQIMAEGVETVEHGEMLLQLGCNLAQGYIIARPMPAQEFPGWASAWRADPAWGQLPLVSREGLPLLFASGEHRAWVKATENYLRGERDAPPQLDHQHCHLGQWLKGEGLARHGDHPSFTTINSLHQQVHVLATELCDLRAQGQSQRALDRVNDLHDLRDALLAQLEPLALNYQQLSQ